MALSNFMNENEKYIVEALKSGIDRDVVEDVLKRASTSEEKQKAIKVILTIQEMKGNDPYSIIRAMNEGIRPNEIAKKFENDINGYNLTFTAGLVSGMCKKQLSKVNQKQNQFYKKYIDDRHNN